MICILKMVRSQKQVILSCLFLLFLVSSVFWQDGLFLSIGCKEKHPGKYLFAGMTAYSKKALILKRIEAFR